MITVNEMFFAIAFFVLGWMLRENYHGILEAFSNLCMLACNQLEKQLEKMPAIQTHRKQYWTAWTLVSAFGIVLSLILRGTRFWVVGSLIILVGFPILYVLLTKVWKSGSETTRDHSS